MSLMIVVVCSATKHVERTQNHEEQGKQHHSQPIDRLNPFEQARILSITHFRALPARHARDSAPSLGACMGLVTSVLFYDFFHLTARDARFFQYPRS